MVHKQIRSTFERYTQDDLFTKLENVLWCEPTDARLLYQELNLSWADQAVIFWNVRPTAQFDHITTQIVRAIKL